MKVVIAGGGIGGLTAALCLEQIGWEVLVLEQAPSIMEIGAGIQISPNGVRVLRALGLSDALDKIGFRPEAIEMRLGQSGEPVFSIALQEECLDRWGAPYLNLHRADLVSLLLHALEERAPGSVRRNSGVSGYEQDGRSVYVSTSDGRRERGDLLLGCDGIHSVVREQMLGPDRPRFTGHVAWRVVVPMSELGDHVPPPTACAWVGPGKHAATYRLRGGRLANLVGTVEHDDWTSESWTEEGLVHEALKDFEGWHPVVTTMLAKAHVHYRWALFDRPPLYKWSEGRVALLGDACHPMLPFLAQGAVMAIEDAWVLADRLRDTSQVANALNAYFDDRIGRTSRVQATSTANAKRFHQRDKVGQIAAWGPLWLGAKIAPGQFFRQMAWLYGHDVSREAGACDEA